MSTTSSELESIFCAALNCGLCLGGVVVEAVELAEEEMGLDVVGLELGEFLVLGDGELQHLAGLGVLHVAEGTEVNLAEQRVGFDVVGFLLTCSCAAVTASRMRPILK